MHEGLSDCGGAGFIAAFSLWIFEVVLFRQSKRIVDWYFIFLREPYDILFLKRDAGADKCARNEDELNDRHKFMNILMFQAEGSKRDVDKCPESAVIF